MKWMLAALVLSSFGCDPWPGFDVIKTTPTKTGGVNGSSGGTHPDGGTTSSDAAMNPDCVALPGGAVAWWTGDGNPGELINHADGAWTGAALYAPGEVGQALAFDGTSALVASQSFLPAGNADRTVEAWVFLINAGSPSAGSMLFQYGRQGNLIGLFGVLVAGGPLAFTNGGSGFQGGAVRAREWTHIAAIARSAQVELYVDGQLVATGEPTLNTFTGASDGQVYIGGVSPAEQGQAQGMNGSVDELTVYNRALDASELAPIVAAGSAGKCRP